jgi:uncharacterized coiled-coil protein SlyX
MSNNKSIDKMAAQFTSLDELQAYCEAQYKTIVSLNKRITENERELEKLREENESLKSNNTVLNAQNAVFEKRDGFSNQFATSDEESTCLIQLAMIRQNALQRELTNEETKRFEVFAKVLHMIRGTENKKEEKLDNMSSDELLKLIDTTMKEPQ